MKELVGRGMEACQPVIWGHNGRPLSGCCRSHGVSAPNLPEYISSRRGRKWPARIFVKMSRMAPSHVRDSAPYRGSHPAAQPNWPTLSSPCCWAPYSSPCCSPQAAASPPASRGAPVRFAREPRGSEHRRTALSRPPLMLSHQTHLTVCAFLSRRRAGRDPDVRAAGGTKHATPVASPGITRH
jgi:hypothetical protein